MIESGKNYRGAASTTLVSPTGSARRFGAMRESLRKILTACSAIARCMRWGKSGERFRYTKNGIKGCSLCRFPHLLQNYGKIMDRFSEIVALTAMIPPQEQ